MNRSAVFCVGLIVGLLPLGSLRAETPVAIVYETEAAVKESRAVLGPMTLDGVVVSSRWALASPQMMVGLFDGTLWKAALITWDQKLDLAIIKPTDLILDETLQAAHRAVLVEVFAFLPAEKARFRGLAGPVESTDVSTAPYRIAINDQPVDEEPIVLPFQHKKSEMNIEIVRLSDAPVWHVELTLTSEPSLSFWRKGRTKGLTEVPRPDFKYKQQMMFRPLSTGRSVKIPVEIYYIKDESYVFHLTVESKGEAYSVSVPVIFQTNN